MVRLASVGGLCAAILGGAALWHHGVGSAKAPAARAAAASRARPAPRFSWPKGTRMVYSLLWSGDTAQDVLPGAVGAEATKSLAFGSSMDADVAIRSFGQEGDSFDLGVGFQTVRAFDLRSAGRSQQGDLDALKRGLEGQEARILVDARGTVHRISFPREMDPKVRSMLRNLVEQLQVTLPAGDAEAWTATEMDPAGIADVRYERGQDDRTLLRKRVQYTSLAAFPGGSLDGTEGIDGGDTIVLDGQGALASIHARQTLAYRRAGEKQDALRSTSSFALEHVETTRFDADGAKVDLESQPLAAAVVDRGAGARRDAQLAEGVSIASILSSVTAFSGSGQLPRNFTTKAGAYLRLHPEEAAKLLAPFVDAQTNAKGRGLLLDVLTAAGIPQAQDVMRKALASPVAAKDGNEYALLVQRFSFVRSPDEDSVRFVKQRLERSTGAARQGEAAALGSMVRRLGPGDRALAAACDTALRDGLRRAQTPDDKKAYVLGLGNARTLEDEGAIAQMATDSSASVRAQVATSLNWFATPDAASTLMTLAGDADPAVAREALLSLGSQTLDPSDWAVLSSRMSSGEVPASLDSALLALVTRQLEGAGADGAAILQQIVTREEGVGDVAARARQLLALNK